MERLEYCTEIENKRYPAPAQRQLSTIATIDRRAGAMSAIAATVRVRQFCQLTLQASVIIILHTASEVNIILSLSELSSKVQCQDVDREEIRES